jgi:hypothetical protein
MPRKRVKIDEPIAGTIKFLHDPDGINRKHFVPLSRGHVLSVYNRLGIDKKVWMTPSVEELTFSESQRSYFFVVIGYLCDYTGSTKDEEYVAIIEDCFPDEVYEKVVHGKLRHFRPSISDVGKMPLPKMQTLIDFAVNRCKDNDIRIPTAKELGYVTNSEGYIGAPKVEYPTDTFIEPKF